MGYGMFGSLVIFRIDLEAQPVVGIPSDGGVYRTFILSDIAPYDSDIEPFYAMLEKPRRS